MRAPPRVIACDCHSPACADLRIVRTGLAFLHSLNIVHRDVSLENMLVDEWGNVKVG